jgi:hypothetical protein
MQNTITCYKTVQTALIKWAEARTCVPTHKLPASGSCSPTSSFLLHNMLRMFQTALTRWAEAGRCVSTHKLPASCCCPTASSSCCCSAAAACCACCYCCCCRLVQGCDHVSGVQIIHASLPWGAAHGYAHELQVSSTRCVRREQTSCCCCNTLLKSALHIIAPQGILPEPTYKR